MGTGSRLVANGAKLIFNGIMGFELKDNSGALLVKDNFTERGLENEEFKAETMNLELPFGSIKARQWLFDGIKINYSESVFDDVITLGWRGDSEIITMHFNLKGKISLTGKNMPGTFVLGSNQHNAFYGQEAEGKMKVDELRLESFLIQLAKNAFFAIADYGNEAIKRFADKVAASIPIAFSDNSLNIDLPLQNCINAVLNCRYEAPLKRMFFHAKVMEMLVLQAESLNKSLVHTPQYIKTEYDRERILFARDYLLKNIDNPPTLAELARIVGINEYKLKRGFKEVFGLPVFEYLAQVRLELAKTDLLENRKTVTDIAFELGYSSLQHFSAAFKKKFGMAPSEVRK